MRKSSGRGWLVLLPWIEGAFVVTGVMVQCCTIVQDSSAATGPLRIIQMSDTHIHVGGDPRAVAHDGRTDNCLPTTITPYYLRFFPGLASQYCDEYDGSSLPTIAMTSAVSSANTLNPEFVVFTGDNVSQKLYDDFKIASVDLFQDLADGLNCDYHVVAAKLHDGVGFEYNAAMFEERVGDLNWGFVQESNLFVGLSEALRGETFGSSNYNIPYLQSLLEQYKNGGMNLFIFLHKSPNNIVVDSGDDHDFISFLESYQNDFDARVVMAGHGHANLYEYSAGTHWVVTTSIMNYPTEFRIVDIYEDRVEIYMSDPISTEVEDASMIMIDYYIENELLFRANPPHTLEGLTGDASERSITIPLPFDTPRGVEIVPVLSSWRVPLLVVVLIGLTVRVMRQGELGAA